MLGFKGLIIKLDFRAIWHSAKYPCRKVAIDREVQQCLCYSLVFKEYNVLSVPQTYCHAAVVC